MGWNFSTSYNWTFFIEDTLNQHVYNTLLREKILPAINLVADLNLVFYQQDGAPSHTARLNTNFLDATFPGRWIGKKGPISWPPRSPDLNPCDFFLWGHLKNQLYQYGRSYAGLEELKEALRDALGRVTPRMLAETRQNFVDRLTHCTAAAGHLFEHLI